MKIPKGYDQKLTQLFDIVVDLGDVPTKQHRDFFRYSNDFVVEITKLIKRGFQVLELGLPSLRFGSLFIEQSDEWQGLETRLKQQQYCSVISKEVSNIPFEVSLSLSCLNEIKADCVMIDFSWLATLSEDDLIFVTQFLDKLNKGSLVVIFQWAVDDNRYYRQTCCADYLRAQLWLKNVSGIMHMGVPKVNFIDGSVWHLLKV